MTIVKSATQHQRKPMLMFFLFGGIWLAFVAFMIVVLDSISVQQILISLSFLAIIIIMFHWAGKHHKEFRCPDCGGEVSEAMETSSQGGVPILRKCERCDVLWHVGSTPTPG
jgi:hypothetical protein